MKTKYLLLTLLLSIIGITSAYTQMEYQVEIIKSQFRTRQVISPSPDAAALGKYGNVPVSLFTGTPNINIPLMDLKGLALTLPVSVSYNASGFKPEEVASWVGLRWTLNAGGVITRSVAGNPDVESNYFKSPSPIKEPNSLSAFDRALYFRGLSYGTDETQPDMYFYNFMGKTGKFYIWPNKNVLKKEKDNMLVISYSADQFSIKDEQGNTYVFDQKEVTSTMGSDEIGAIPNAYNFTSSWYLSSVTSASGLETLLFEYYAPAGQQEIYQGALGNQTRTWTYVTSSCVNTSPYIDAPPTSSVSPTPTRVTRKFLKKIRLVRSGTDIAYIDFISAVNQRQDLWNASLDGERRLDELKMYAMVNGVAVLVKNSKLFYSYYPTTESAFGGMKLRLDKIQEISVKTGTPNRPPYQFEYNTGNLPRKFTLSLDHWGYYNGASNTSLLPNVNAVLDGTSKTYGGNADREPNFAAASLALISKIIYPTSGYTTFEFEGLGSMGGVRIKKINDYAFNGTLASSKQYSYADAHYGKRPKYDYMSYYTSTSSGCVGDLCSCPNTGRKAVTISSTSTFGLGFSRGAEAVYGKVTESTVNATGTVMGGIITTYVTGTPTEFDEDIRSGSIAKQEFYDNGGKLVREISNTYNYLESNTLDALRIIPEVNQDNKTAMCEKNVGGTLQVSYYADLSGQTCVRTATITTRFTHYDMSVVQQSNLLSQQVVKQYDPATGTYLTLTKNYTYGPYHINPILIEEQSSNNGEVVGTSIKYTGDYTYGTGTDPIANGLRAASANNIRAAEVERVQYRMNADGSNKRYIGGLITTYFDNGLPNKLFRLELPAPITSFTPSTISSAVFTYHSSYKLLGSFTYNGPLNLVEQSKANDMPTSYIWDYQDSYAIASVSNAANNTIVYSSFETGQTGGWTITGATYNTSTAITGKRSLNLVTGNEISKTFAQALVNSQVISYWTKSSTPLTVLANNSAVSASIADVPVNGWYYFQHVAPAGTNSIKISSASAIVDELRSYPVNALMTSYTYDPEFGMTSECDPANKITYYEYDGLARLVNARDRENNIVKNYQYNYGLGSSITSPQKIYYNDRKTVTLTKTDCASGTYPTTETYVVEAGKYAALSKTVANQLADQDIQANGQTEVNRLGRCYFKNVAMSTTYYKQGCTDQQGPALPYTFGAYAGQFTSFVSQADADLQASNYTYSNLGQNAANLNGHCTCEEEGTKWMFGNKCQKGTRVNFSYRYIPATGMYECKYMYLFTDGSQSPYYYDYNPYPCVNP